MADLTRHEQFLNHIAHPDAPIPAPQTRTEFLLKEIAENKDEAALPDYSEASDGDVLSIDNGAPAWKPGGGGGGGLLVVKITEDETTGNLVADKNYNEISAAVSSGTPVIGVAILQDLEIACDTVVVLNNGATFTGYFSEVSGSSLELTVQKYLLSKGSSGTSYNVTSNEYTFTIS